ncbi:MAG TPA: hypothetical protein VI320_21405 [Terracidiphilus sp.]|jgi:hypothetical protein
MATLMDNLGIMERARQILSAAGRRARKQEAANRQSARISSGLPSNTVGSTPRPIWMVTEARVTECHHELVRISALTLRITDDPNRLIVSFIYYAHARTHYDSFLSPVAMSKGETFSVYYNALNPSENTQSPCEPTERNPVPDITILGFTTLSILFFTMVRG